MTVTRNLTFERFRSEQIKITYGSNWTGRIDNYVIERATESFCWTILDALRDALFESVRLSDATKTNRGIYFIRFGVGRRLNMMWYAYRSFIYAVPPARTKPLSSEESLQLTENLNSIYINIRGTLDNLCWALLSEFSPQKLTSNPREVGLFNACIRNNRTFGPLATAIETHKVWYKDLKLRRDPAAHRIPLTVPPQEITAEEAKTYQSLLDQHESAAAALDFDRAERMLKATEQIGRFIACFVHDPEEAPIPIYPTLPNDVGHLVELFRAVDTFFKRPR